MLLKKVSNFLLFFQRLRLDIIQTNNTLKKQYTFEIFVENQVDVEID